MIKCIAVFTACLIFRLAHSQGVAWSEPVKTTRDVVGVEVISTDDKGFFVAELNKKEEALHVIRYNYSDMKPQWNRSIPIPSGQSGLEYEMIIHVKDKFMLFTSGFEKESEQLQVFCTFYDNDCQKLSGPALVHYTLSEGRTSAPLFGITLSPDSKHMLLYFDPPFERKTTEAISFKCYDAELDMIWEKEIQLPYTQDIVQVHKFLLDNTGNIYMMSGRNPLKQGVQWQKPQGGRYVVFFYGHKENKLKEYDISLKDKQVLSVAFDLNSAQDVMITGYYSNDFKFSAAGTFLFVIGAYGTSVKAASFMPFPKDFLNKFLRQSQVENDVKLPDFYLDHMMLADDGTIILLGEQYYSTEYVITDPTTGRQTVEHRYNFDDMIATRLDANGRQTWNVKIPKRQFVTSGVETCSYQYFETPTGVQIFFNDDPENQQRLASLKESEASTWNGSRNSVTTKVTVDKNGEFVRETLVSNKEQDALLKTTLGSLSGSGVRVLGYEDGRSYKFCVVR